MKRQAPTERELTDMIAKAFERLPAPDPRRLAAIEERLLTEERSRARSKIAWWWLAGALVAGAATAIWWALDYDSVEGEKEPIPKLISPSAEPSVVKQPARPSQSEGTESKPAGGPAQKQGSVIYQKER